MSSWKFEVHVWEKKNTNSTYMGIRRSKRTERGRLRGLDLEEIARLPTTVYTGNLVMLTKLAVTTNYNHKTVGVKQVNGYFTINLSIMT